MRGVLRKVLAATLGITLIGGFAEPAQAESHKLLVGATIVKETIGYWEPKLVDNSIIRVFPNSDGTIPDVSDDRFDYARRIGMRQIFVSTKIRTKFVGGGHGSWSAGMTDTKNRIKDLIDTGDFDVVWYTEHHEPEQGSDARTSTSYKTDYTMSGGVFATINGIGSAYRPKVKVGHVLTRQWTENTAGRTYATFDTGLGDYFGVDMYANSWGSNGCVATSYPDPVTFVAKFKAYKKSSTDTRDRIWPELGAIGIPSDPTGTARELWLQNVHKQANQMDPTTTGWNMVGWIWWNAEGKGGNTLCSVGNERYFELDRYMDGSGSGDNGTALYSTPHPLNRFNQISAYNNN